MCLHKDLHGSKLPLGVKGWDIKHTDKKQEEKYILAKGKKGDGEVGGAKEIKQAEKRKKL